MRFRGDERFVRYTAGRLLRALERSRVRVSNPAFLHLVGVAARANDKGMVCRLVSGEPLFMRYERAFAWPQGSFERAFILEEVGDAGLLLAGYWWQQLDGRREPVDVDYVMRLGRLAYRYIGWDAYGELADKYSRLIDAFTVLGTHYAPLMHRDQAILAIYKAWERSHVPRAARVLGRLGIPVDRSIGANKKVPS